MDSAIIGYTGFVGGNLISQKQFSHFYNSKNIEEIEEKNFDLVVCSGAPAVKWWANKNPAEDWSNLNRLMESLARVAAKKLILISTVDVYPAPVDVDETNLPDFENNHAYGKHRFKLEEFVRTNFSENYIVRLPALFGSGLKKNAVFDLMHNNNIDQIDSEGRFQFYDVGKLWSDVERGVNNGIRLLNITSEPVTIGEIAAQVFGMSFVNKISSKAPLYRTRSCYSNLWGKENGFQYSKTEIIEGLQSFVKIERESKNKGLPV